MPGSAAAAMAMKRKRNEQKKQEQPGPRAAPALDEGEWIPKTPAVSSPRVICKNMLLCLVDLWKAEAAALIIPSVFRKERGASRKRNPKGPGRKG